MTTSKHTPKIYELAQRRRGVSVMEAVEACDITRTCANSLLQWMANSGRLKRRKVNGDAVTKTRFHAGRESFDAMESRIKADVRERKRRQMEASRARMARPGDVGKVKSTATPVERTKIVLDGREVLLTRGITQPDARYHVAAFEPHFSATRYGSAES